MPENIPQSAIKLSGRDAGKENVSWVRLAPIGRDFWDGRRVRQIDENMASEIVANFQKANHHFEASTPDGSTPYRIPVDVEHRGGSRLGDVIDLKISDDSLFAKTRWLESTWNEIQAGKAQHVSVVIEPSYHLDSGEELGWMLTSYAVTSEPRIQSQGRIQDTLDLQLNRHSNEDLDMNEEVKEAFASLLATMKEVQASVSQVAEKLAEGAPVEEAEEALEDVAEAVEDAVEAVEDAPAEEPVEAAKEEEQEEEAIAASRTPDFDFEAMEDRIVAKVTEALSLSRGPSNRPHTREIGNEGVPSANGIPKDPAVYKAQLKAQGMTESQIGTALYRAGF